MSRFAPATPCWGLACDTADCPLPDDWQPANISTTTDAMKVLQNDFVTIADSSRNSDSTQNVLSGENVSVGHPLSVQFEACPEVGVLALAEAFPEFRLGQSQGRGRRFTFAHVMVEPLHQLRCSLVIDLPKAGHHCFGAGEEKGPRKAHGAFPRLLLADSSTARAKDNQVCREFHLVDVFSEKVPGLWGTIGLHTGQDNLREFRMARIGQ